MEDIIIEKVMAFAGKTLDGDIAGQSYLNPAERRAVDKRIAEIEVNKFYRTYLFRVCDIHPEDREKYVKILAFMGF